MNFQKERGEYLLDCIANGKAIEPPECGWTINAMLAVAGACHFAALSHGPIVAKAMGIDVSKLPTEYQEAHEETLFADLQAAIGFYSHLTMLVKEGTYHEQFEPSLPVVVRQTGEVHNEVVPIQGHRK
ncbi:MAG: hypothetical protein WCJ35_17470 [Planctomycetota bacterium]